MLRHRPKWGPRLSRSSPAVGWRGGARLRNASGKFVKYRPRRKHPRRNPVTGKFVGSSRRRNPAGPLLMVNPGRKYRPKKRTVRSRKPSIHKRKIRRIRNMAKSAKRRRAGKKAWRTRLARMRARRHNPKKTKKSYSKPKARKTTKAKAAPKRRKSRRTRQGLGKALAAMPALPRRKRRKARKSSGRLSVGWRGDKARHSKAAGKGWRGRKIYKKKVYKYKKPHQTRGVFARWKNPDGLKDIALPIALAVGGIIGATLLMKKLFIDKSESTGKSILDSTKMPKVADINLGLLIPAAVGVASMVFLTKKAPKYAKMIYGLGFGLTIASGIAVYNQFVANTKVKNPDSQLPTIGGSLMGYSTYPFSGYVRSRSMRGYVRSPLAGYVPSNLGQLEARVPRTLGEPVTYRGALPPAGVVSQRALAYQPLSVKPYGMGLPKESRRYNEFDFSGVYDNSVYE